MSDEHDRVAEWDGAYVLGALSPTDRRIFEEHLAECAACRDAVARLAPTAGLLSRVPAERARALGDVVDEPPAELRAGVVRAFGQRRARRRTIWTLAAAAALIIGGISIPVGVALTQPQGVTHALDDVAGAPLEASVRLTDAPWGTEIELVCQYTGAVLETPEDGFPYALAVVGRDGTTSTLSTWRAAPGSTTRLSAGTDLPLGDIGSIEIRRLDGAQDVVMRYDAATS